DTFTSADTHKLTPVYTVHTLLAIPQTAGVCFVRGPCVCVCTGGVYGGRECECVCVYGGRVCVQAHTESAPAACAKGQLPCAISQPWSTCWHRGGTTDGDSVGVCVCVCVCGGVCVCASMCVR